MRNQNGMKQRINRLIVIMLIATAASFAAERFASAQGDPIGPIDGQSIDIPVDETDETVSASKGGIVGAISTRNLLQVVRGGGPMMFAIALCSFVLVVFVFERAISLRRGRVIPRPFVKRFLEQLRDGELKVDEAVSLCEENRSPVAEVFAAGVKKWDRPSVEVEQAIIDSGERVSNVLRRYLRLFNGIATISPLLGLLGTVLVMISAFNSIAQADAMGRPEVLANGISQALLTTAGGLSVAIPAFIAYLYFAGRVDRLIMDIDDLGQELVGEIASDVWRPKKTRKSKTKAAA